ncbi:class I SAM-dependent methyltransferase [Salinispora arenicola]|uniref:class I SAM-dependent methyltransferase n=1 Tax=Salinispora arenicola TaxID=168697 RepID=UPI0003808F27|nr:class I SAM-dependent methyltransferase [Salinispora arenicola]MCN0180307.1 class I SAM-dependent methyltransferase [Salinispora arenicola]
MAGPVSSADRFHVDSSGIGQTDDVTDSVGPDPQYELFADEFLDHAREGLYNAHYDRPACLRLLGEVAGRTVLDVACGPGLYAEELVGRGARVIGLDQSPRMVQLCRQRVPSGEFRVHDLADRLHWLPDDSVDLVLFALGLEYVDDRTSTLRELRRVLRPDGALVLSRLHPTGDWLRHGGSYFDVRIVEETWSRGWQVRYWLAPLERTCEELHEAGFLIERLVEPRPTAEAAHVDRDRYERLLREPIGFLAIRALPAPWR